MAQIGNHEEESYFEKNAGNYTLFPVVEKCLLDNCPKGSDLRASARAIFTEITESNGCCYKHNLEKFPLELRYAFQIFQDHLCRRKREEDLKATENAISRNLAREAGY